MANDRKIAVLVGVLFIIGTVSGVTSVVVTPPVLSAPNYLTLISNNPGPIIAGVLLVLSMGLSLSMVPVVIWPVLKRHNETLAVGYIVFRGALEMITYLVSAMSWLLLIPLSAQFAAAGTVDAGFYQTFGKLLIETAEIAGTLTAILFPLGAIMLYVVFYQANLIPRWLSIWGLIGVGLHLVFTGLAGLFVINGALPTIFLLLNIPIALQEMVMAVWLIAKGFTAPAVARPTAAPVAAGSR